MSPFNFNAREFLRNHAKYQNSVFAKLYDIFCHYILITKILSWIENQD